MQSFDSLLENLTPFKNVLVTFSFKGQTHVIRMSCVNLRDVIHTGRHLRRTDIALRSRLDQDIQMERMHASDCPYSEAADRITAEHIINVQNYGRVLFSVIEPKPFVPLTPAKETLIANIEAAGAKSVKVLVDYKGKTLALTLHADRFIDFVKRDRPLEPRDLTFSKRANERFLYEIGAWSKTGAAKSIYFRRIKEVTFRRDVLYTH